VDEHSGKLKKDLGWMGILAAAYNVSNSWLVIAATMVISVGFGPMNTIWGVILITSIYACIGLSLAELVSAYPTVGGQYHWTSILAPAGMRNMLVGLEDISMRAI
jgi:choline transport protein